jgi:DNA-binding transcriptional regulator YhcF (GntR family)
MGLRRERMREGLRQHVTSGLHLGELHRGDRLGSARQTARQSGGDYRQVVDALRGLESDGLLEIRPRGGIYVGLPAPQPRADRQPGFADRLVDLLLVELASGSTIAAVAGSLSRCLHTVGLRVACLECNQDQLDFLARELHAGFALDSVAIEVDRLRVDWRRKGPPLALRQADLLVSTTFHAGEVRRWAARLGKPYVIVTLDERRRIEVARLLAERPVYFIGTDPRWAAKARAIWAGVPGVERLHALTLGLDPLEGIPESAAVMVMPRARQLLAGNALLERALPARGFSRDSARQLLAFLVETNLARATSRDRAR